MIDGLDGTWVLVLLMWAAALVVSLILDALPASARREELASASKCSGDAPAPGAANADPPQASGLSQVKPSLHNHGASAEPVPTARRTGVARILGQRRASLTAGLLGLVSLALAGRFFAAALVGGALLALAWVLWGRADWRARLTRTSGLWIQSIVVLLAVVMAVLAFAAWVSSSFGTRLDMLDSASRWLLRSPAAAWLAALFLCASLIEIAGRLAGFALPRPGRLLSALVALYGGIVLLLMVLGWTLHGGAPGDFATGSHVAGAPLLQGAAGKNVTGGPSLPSNAPGRLHGLALTALVLGLAFLATLAASLIALARRAGSVRPDALEVLASAEWGLALGDDSAALDADARSSGAAGSNDRAGLAWSLTSEGKAGQRDKGERGKGLGDKDQGDKGRAGKRRGKQRPERERPGGKGEGDKATKNKGPVDKGATDQGRLRW